MRALGVTVLILIAVFTGGCSIVFTPILLNGYNSIAGLLWLSGLGIAALCFWGIRTILRKSKKGTIPPPAT